MKRPLKLVTVGHSYIVELNRRLAHAMAQESGGKWEVTAVAPRYFHGSRDLRPLHAQENPQESIHVDFIPAHFTASVHTFLYAHRLKALLRRADLVHCWEEPFVAAGAQVAWFTPRNVPLVFATFQNLPKRYPPPFNLLERYSMGRASGWIAFAQSVAQTQQPRPIYANRPMRQIPPGVDLQTFRADPAARSAVRRSLGWEVDGPPVVGFLGRFLPEKGIADLMSALDQVAAPWRALFVGAGPMQPQLESWAQKHGDRVRICADVVHTAVPSYLNAMDMLAAPSRTTMKWREQFGRMLIEGFASSLPVLGSASGEIPHVLGDAGKVLPEQNPGAWAEAIASLIDSPEQRRQMGLRGLERASQLFSWPVIARRHIEFFEELLEAKSPASTATIAGDVPRATGALPPRKLLSIAHSYAVGVNRRLAHEMSIAGGGRWDVTAVAPRYFHGRGDLRPVSFEKIEAEQVRVEVVPAYLTRFVHLFFYSRQLKSILREPWDLIHAWEEPYITVGYQIARWARDGVPIVYRTAQSLSKHYPPPFNWMEKYDMARAAGWICSGTLVADTLGAKDIYQRRPSRLIPLGVDVDFYRAPAGAFAKTMADLEWDENGPPVIGYLGRFVTAKGLQVLTDALDDVRTPWRAIFVGAGPMEGFLRRWAARHEGRVRVCTNVRHNDVPRYLSVMNVLAAPSQTTRHWREQFGRMLIEAFAAGVAVIGSDSGEIPHVIGDSGIVCGERDHHAWVRELRSLIDNPARSAELAEKGLQRAHQQYAWPVVARQYIDFFDQLTSSNVRSNHGV